MQEDQETLAKEMEEALAGLPMFDAHTHLVGGHLGARGLHDILLYHMVVSDLYAAGCPSGARLTQYPGWPTDAEAHQRLTEAIPYLRHTQNTGCSWVPAVDPPRPLRLARAGHIGQLAAVGRVDPRTGRRPRLVVLDLRPA